METLIVWVAFYWLVGTMVRFGYIPIPLSLLFFGIIGLGNGVRLGLFAWYVRRTAALVHPWWYRLLVPTCAYVMLDYVFPRVFPWYLGTVQRPAVLLIQIADITGVHGITWLLVMCSIIITTFFPHPTRPSRAAQHLMIVAFVMLMMLTVGYGVWRQRHVTRAMQQAPTLKVGLIQPNIGIAEKGQPYSRKAHFQLQLDMSRQLLPQQPDVIIWPETMYPYPVTQHAQHLPFPAMPEPSLPSWLIGAIVYDQDTEEVFNSALLLGPQANILGRYDKQKLLAFGEYIPLQHYLPFLGNISPTIGNLTPGAGGLVTLPNGVRIGPLICYEDILPALGRQAVRQGATLLVNLTNNAWFGKTYAPYLHRMLATFRAIENRVYLVRSTNTGLTSIIDPLGREHAPLPIYQRATHMYAVQPLQLSTVYTRFGDWFAQWCSAMAVLLPLGRWYYRRQKRREESGG
jgi:apolipoprotein N-acyltransferase